MAKINQLKINRRKLKATTIVETLTALVLISIAFGVGILIFLNVSTSRSIMKEEQYQLIVENIRTTTFEKEAYKSEKYRLDNFVVVKIIRPYHGIKNLYKLSIQLYDEYQNKELLKTEEIFFLPPQSE